MKLKQHCLLYLQESVYELKKIRLDVHVLLSIKFFGDLSNLSPDFNELDELLFGFCRNHLYNCKCTHNIKKLCT